MEKGDRVEVKLVKSRKEDKLNPVVGICPDGRIALIERGDPSKDLLEPGMHVVCRAETVKEKYLIVSVVSMSLS